MSFRKSTIAAFLLSPVLIFSWTSCSGGSGLSGSGASNSSKNRKPDHSSQGSDGDQQQQGTGDSDGAGAGANGPNGRGSGDYDGAGTGFDKKETLPDGTMQLTKRGESTRGVAPVDIVFAFDTSGSMDQEKAALQQKLPDFIKKLEAAGKDVDYRVWMIAQGFTFPTIDGTKMEIVDVPVGSNNALARLTDFVGGTGSAAGRVKTKLRDVSHKHFVVITDDNATGTVATDFISLATTNPILKDRTSFNGVIGLTRGAGGGGANCEIAAVGEQYQILAGEKNLPSGQKSPFKGLIQDLCAADWTTKLVDTLAAKVIRESLRLEFPLPNDARGASNLAVKIAGKDVPPSGFSYDAARNAIVFTNSTAPKLGEELIVRYLPKST
jgi:hypothetical protein